MLFFLYLLLGSSKILTTNEKHKFTTGFDHRYNITETNFDQIHCIHRSFSKVALLHILENPKIFTIEKVKIIKHSDLICESSMMPNVTKGGLYNDWEINFSD